MKKIKILNFYEDSYEEIFECNRLLIINYEKNKKDTLADGHYLFHRMTVNGKRFPKNCLSISIDIPFEKSKEIVDCAIENDCNILIDNSIGLQNQLIEYILKQNFNNKLIVFVNDKKRVGDLISEFGLAVSFFKIG